MMESHANDVRELAWTVAGALAGSLARRWIDPVWPGTARGLAYTLAITLAAAALAGFARGASIPEPVKTALLGAGGAAGSISVAATRAASATPAHSIIGLVAFFGGAAVGLLSGMSLATFAANHRRVERY